MDLRETVALLDSISREHLDSDLGERDTVLCILAGGRRLELETVTERVEATAAFRADAGAAVAAGVCAAVLVPIRQSSPAE